MFELSTIHERVNDSTESMNFRSLILNIFFNFLLETFSARFLSEQQEIAKQAEICLRAKSIKRPPEINRGPSVPFRSRKFNCINSITRLIVQIIGRTEDKINHSVALAFGNRSKLNSIGSS